MEMISFDGPVPHRGRSLAVLTASLVAALPVLLPALLTAGFGVGGVVRWEQPLASLGLALLPLTGPLLGLLAGWAVIRHGGIGRTDRLAGAAVLALGLCLGTYAELLVSQLVMPANMPAAEPPPPGWQPGAGPVPPEPLPAPVG